MKTANCRLVLAKNGSDVALSGVTPAEVALLRTIHGPKLGKECITDLSENKEEVKRSAGEEKSRLLRKYKRDIVEKCFPGVSPALPESFGTATAKEVPPAKLTA